jgi:hypothetical protein
MRIIGLTDSWRVRLVKCGATGDAGIDRRAILPTAVLFLAAGYALRVLVGVVEGGPNAGPMPEVDVEQRPVDPVLVPVRDIEDPAAQREPAGPPRHRFPDGGFDPGRDNFQSHLRGAIPGLFLGQSLPASSRDDHLLDARDGE